MLKGSNDLLRGLMAVTETLDRITIKTPVQLRCANEALDSLLAMGAELDLFDDEICDDIDAPLKGEDLPALDSGYYDDDDYD